MFIIQKRAGTSPLFLSRRIKRRPWFSSSCLSSIASCGDCRIRSHSCPYPLNPQLILQPDDALDPSVAKGNRLCFTCKGGAQEDPVAVRMSSGTAVEPGRHSLFTADHGLCHHQGKVNINPQPPDKARIELIGKHLRVEPLLPVLQQDGAAKLEGTQPWMLRISSIIRDADQLAAGIVAAILKNTRRFSG